MENLKNQRFTAKSWHDQTKEVSGTLSLIDFKTLESPDPKVNRNGYLLVISNEFGKHIIDPNSVELIPDPKINQWDELDKEIGACYVDENGNEIEGEEYGLGTIGEIAATAFGYL